MDEFLYISIALISYVITLILLKKLGCWRKRRISGCSNCCPRCNDPLERIKRKRHDHSVNYITFQIFEFKRYKCLHCSWEGIRWEKPFSGKF